MGWGTGTYLLGEILEEIEFTQDQVNVLCDLFYEYGCDTVRDVGHPKVQVWSNKKYGEDWG